MCVCACVQIQAETDGAVKADLTQFLITEQSVSVSETVYVIAGFLLVFDFGASHRQLYSEDQAALQQPTFPVHED